MPDILVPPWQAARLHPARPVRNAARTRRGGWHFGIVGLAKCADRGDPVLVLYEDSDVPGIRLRRRPRTIHLLSTVGLPRGLERVGVIASADEVVEAMPHPSDPGSRGILRDLPEGTDGPVAGSSRTP